MFLPFNLFFSQMHSEALSMFVILNILIQQTTPYLQCLIEHVDRTLCLGDLPVPAVCSLLVRGRRRWGVGVNDCLHCLDVILEMPLPVVGGRARRCGRILVAVQFLVQRVGHARDLERRLELLFILREMGHGGGKSLTSRSYEAILHLLQFLGRKERKISCTHHEKLLLKQTTKTITGKIAI